MSRPLTEHIDLTLWPRSDLLETPTTRPTVDESAVSNNSCVGRDGRTLSPLKPRSSLQSGSEATARFKRAAMSQPSQPASAVVLGSRRRRELAMLEGRPRCESWN